MQAKVSESLYDEELKKRKEIEEALAKEKEKLIKMKKQRNEFMEELQIVLDKNSLFENQIAESDKIVKGLEQRIALAMEQLQTYKKEWDELQIEHCKALKEVQELRSKQGEVSSTHMPYFLSEFSYMEIKEATQNFDPSLKIRQGRYRSIYNNVWHHMQVAIKMLHHHSLQEPFELQREVRWFLPCIFICELVELIVPTQMSLGALTIYLFRT